MQSFVTSASKKGTSQQTRQRSRRRAETMEYGQHDSDELEMEDPSGSGSGANAPVSSIHSSMGYGYGYGYGYDSGGDERSLREYPRILLRYWPLIIAFLALGAGIAVFQTSKTARLYRSTALLNIGTYVPPVEGPTGDLLKEETRTKTYANTQIRLLTSYTLADKVLRSNRAILQYLGAKTPKKNERLPVPILQRYLGIVSFHALQDTNLVEIYATTTSPPLAALVANAHARSFIDLIKQRQQTAANVNLQYLQERYEEATEQVKEAETARLKFAEEFAISLSNDQILEQTYVDKYKGLIGSLNNALSERASFEADYSSLKKSKGIGQPSLQAQQIQLFKMEEQYRSLKKRLGGTRTPYLDYLEREINSNRRTLRKIGKTALQTSRNKFKSTTERVQMLEGEINRLQDEQFRMSKHKIEYDRLKQNVISAREVQKSIASRLEDAVINAQSNQETVALVDRAFPPLYHISPDERSNFLTGCMVGGIIGVLLALLLDHLDTRVHSVRDLQVSVQAPVLGMIPKFKPKAAIASTEVEEDGYGEHQHHPSLLPVSAPFSPGAESMRSVLTTLTSSLPEYTSRIILVTSGQKGDGKTTVSINLAATLSQFGEKTLLIDADLRLPKVHGYFNIDRETPGVSNYIQDESIDATEVIYESGVDGLYILPAGSATSNPAGQLKSDRMAELLLMMSEEFDYVIIDSPPVGPVADALLLSRFADGVAVVVKSGETSTHVAESAVSRLRQVGANILGLVLNHSTGGANYWKTGYGKSGHSYYAE